MCLILVKHVKEKDHYQTITQLCEANKHSAAPLKIFLYETEFSGIGKSLETKFKLPDLAKAIPPNSMCFKILKIIQKNSDRLLNLSRNSLSSHKNSKISL